MSSIKMFENLLGCAIHFPKFTKVRINPPTGRDLLRARGYEFIKTPSVEYYDTMCFQVISDARLFKLVDSQGIRLCYVQI